MMNHFDNGVISKGIPYDYPGASEADLKDMGK